MAEEKRQHGTKREERQEQEIAKRVPYAVAPRDLGFTLNKALLDFTAPKTANGTRVIRDQLTLVGQFGNPLKWAQILIANAIESSQFR